MSVRNKIEGAQRRLSFAQFMYMYLALSLLFVICFSHFSHMLQASAARIKQVSHAPLFNIFVKTRWMTLCHSQHSVIVHTNHSTEDL